MRPLRLTALVLAAFLLAFFPGSQAQANSPRIAALQVALKSLHLYAGQVDGISGPLTRRGIVRLQRRNGIKPDGLLGPRTKRALGWRGRPAIGSRTMRFGSRGWDVAALQFLLQRGGYGVGRADGIFGPLTRQAVIRAQRAAGFKPDGLAGAKTVAFLRKSPAGFGADPGVKLVGNETPVSPIAFQRPVSGPIGDRFGAGRERGRKHAGLDFPVPHGTPILASAAGTVIFAGYNSGGYGNLVVVQHPYGYTTWYAHMSKVQSTVGQTVTAGTQLGLVGSTGNSTGPHLHFEIRQYDTHLDPEPLITPEATMARRSSTTKKVTTTTKAAPKGGHDLICKPAPTTRTGGYAPGAAGDWIANEQLCRPRHSVAGH